MAGIRDERFPAPVHPGSETLRRAIRESLVSFPSQIPGLLKCPPADTQRRIVLLFFVRGWSSAKIGARFQVPKHRIWKILNGWSVRALALGYIQVIDPEGFAACCHVGVEQEVPVAVVQSLPAAVAKRTGNGPVNGRSASADSMAALHAAFAQYETWRDEFQERTATLLHELRTVAAALDRRYANEQTEGLPAALRAGEGPAESELLRRGKERVSHAVA